MINSLYLIKKYMSTTQTLILFILFQFSVYDVNASYIIQFLYIACSHVEFTQSVTINMLLCSISQCKRKILLSYIRRPALYQSSELWVQLANSTMFYTKMHIEGLVQYYRLNKLASWNTSMVYAEDKHSKMGKCKFV